MAKGFERPGEEKPSAMKKRSSLGGAFPIQKKEDPRHETIQNGQKMQRQ